MATIEKSIDVEVPVRTSVTTPAFGAPERARQAMRSSGICSVISASHTFSVPPTTVRQCR
jgi:hypothetical protein